MNYIIKQIEELIISKKSIFKEYEKLTNELISCEGEDMEQLIENRQILIKKINDIDSQIANLSEEIQYGKSIIDAEKNRKGRDKFSKELLHIYDLGQEIFTVINRIKNMEPCIYAKAEKFKDEAEKSIRKSNNVPKIATYFNHEDNIGNILLSKKYEKV